MNGMDNWGKRGEKTHTKGGKLFRSEAVEHVPETEYGWLIEGCDKERVPNGRCIGGGKADKFGRKLIAWTTPDLAIRFARECDAQLFITINTWNPCTLVAVEHQ